MSYGKVYDAYWEGDKIDPLSDRAALLGLYLITGAHRNAIGCFRLGMGRITDEKRFLNWGIDGVSIALLEMVKTGFIMRDDASGWTMITNALVKDPIKGPKAAVHAAKLAAAVPAHLPLYRELKQILEPQLEPEAKALAKTEGWPMRSPIDGVSQGLSIQNRSPSPFPAPLPEPAPDTTTVEFSQTENPPAPKPSKAADVQTLKDFDAWYALYPRKEGKKEGLVAYRRAHGVVGPRALLDALVIYAQACVGTDRKHIKLPATWLNGEHWTDEINLKEQNDVRRPNAGKSEAELTAERRRGILAGLGMDVAEGQDQRDPSSRATVVGSERVRPNDPNRQDVRAADSTRDAGAIRPADGRTDRVLPDIRTTDEPNRGDGQNLPQSAGRPAGGPAGGSDQPDDPDAQVSRDSVAGGNPGEHQRKLQQTHGLTERGEVRDQGRGAPGARQGGFALEPQKPSEIESDKPLVTTSLAGAFPIDEVPFDDVPFDDPQDQAGASAAGDEDNSGSDDGSDENHAVRRSNAILDGYDYGKSPEETELPHEVTADIVPFDAPVVVPLRASSGHPLLRKATIVAAGARSISDDITEADLAEMVSLDLVTREQAVDYGWVPPVPVPVPAVLS